MFRNDLSKSYSTAPQPGNPRATEAWALSQSALRMKAGQVSADRGEILAAARLNWRLWTILQSALLEPECLNSHAKCNAGIDRSCNGSKV